MHVAACVVAAAAAALVAAFAWSLLAHAVATRTVGPYFAAKALALSASLPLVAVPVLLQRTAAVHAITKGNGRAKSHDDAFSSADPTGTALAASSSAAALLNLLRRSPLARRQIFVVAFKALGPFVAALAAYSVLGTAATTGTVTIFLDTPLTAGPGYILPAISMNDTRLERVVLKGSVVDPLIRAELLERTCSIDVHPTDPNTIVHLAGIAEVTASSAEPVSLLFTANNTSSDSSTNASERPVILCSVTLRSLAPSKVQVFNSEAYSPHGDHAPEKVITTTISGVALTGRQVVDVGNSTVPGAGLPCGRNIGHRVVSVRGSDGALVVTDVVSTSPTNTSCVVHTTALSVVARIAYASAMSAELPRSAAQQEHPVQSGLAAVSPSSFGGSVILAGALNLTSVTAGATAASLTSSSQDLTSRTVLVLVLLAAVLLTYVTFIVPKLTTAYKTLFAAADDGILGLLHMPCTTDDTGLEDGFAQVEEGCAVVGAAGRSDVGGRGKTGRRAEERNHYGLIRKEAEAAREGLLFAGASTGEEEEP